MNQSAAGNGRPVVALPETRQLNVLAELLERRGASVVRCPMVAILDSPDADSVVGWIRRFIDDPMDLLIIYTGEGVERLLKFAARAELKDEFIAALARTRKLARGPKPGRALRRVSLKPEIVACAPTTDGVIETLNSLSLENARVGVQLYGRDPQYTDHVPWQLTILLRNIISCLVLLMGSLWVVTLGSHYQDTCINLS